MMDNKIIEIIFFISGFSLGGSILNAYWFYKNLEKQKIIDELIKSYNDN